MKSHLRHIPAVILLGSLLIGTSACSSSPEASTDATPQASATSSESPAAEPGATESNTPAPEVKLTAQEKFVKEVTVSKPLDLSGLVMPADVKSKFPDEGKGAVDVMTKFIQEANSIPELQKGSHINSAADYPLFEGLRPLMHPDLFESLKNDYVQPAGTAIVANYVNSGDGMNTLVQGNVHPDDNGMTWQWGNEKATAQYIAQNDLEGLGITLPVRYSFNTTDKGVISLYATRTYAMIHQADGTWVVGGVQWSGADVRSSQDSASTLELESPIDNPG